MHRWALDSLGASSRNGKTFHDAATRYYEKAAALGGESAKSKTTLLGKTSFINTVILSMIRKYKKPEELGFVMIGKTDELHVFDEIPQLVRPVITDPSEAAGLRFWR